MSMASSGMMDDFEPAGLWQSLFHGGVSAMALIDENFLVIEANEALFKSFGQEYQAHDSVPFGNLFSCAALANTQASCGTAPACRLCGLRQAAMDEMQSSISARGREMAYEDNYGDRRDRKWFSVSSQPIAGRDKRYVLLTLIDITAARRHEETLAQIGITDRVTGLFNQRFIIDQLNKQLILLGARKEPLVVALVAIDGLKPAGGRGSRSQIERVMRLLAQIIRSSIRYSDFAGRYGSEALLLLLPECHEEQGQQVIDRIRSLFANASADGMDQPAGISAGLLEICSDNAGAPARVAAIAQAGDLLERARAAGKNQTLSAKIQGDLPGEKKEAEDETNAAV